MNILPAPQANEPWIITYLKLIWGMLVAANLSAMAAYLAIYLANFEVEYFETLGIFLAFRVFMYMGSKPDELTPDFVHYLSVQRSKWGAATIIVTSIMILIKHFI